MKYPGLLQYRKVGGKSLKSRKDCVQLSFTRNLTWEGLNMREML